MLTPYAPFTQNVPLRREDAVFRVRWIFAWWGSPLGLFRQVTEREHHTLTALRNQDWAYVASWRSA